jgi:hypothetical protein
MKPIRAMGLCLVAMFAFGALVAASASAALPEYRTCIKAVKVGKKYTGKYNNATCSELNAKGEGKYELGSWNQAKKLTFKGKYGESSFDSYIPENEAEPWAGGSVVGAIVCKSGTTSGEITGPSTSIATDVYKDCTSEGKKCWSPGQKAGTIESEPITTTLVYGPSGEVVALLLKKHKGIEETVEIIDCEGLEIAKGGTVLAAVSGDVNTFSKSSQETFSVNAHGGQADVFCEGAPRCAEGPLFLTATITPPGVTLPSGESAVATLKGELMEIEAA